MTTLIMMITLPSICQYIPANDWEACNPPPVNEMPVLLSWYDPKLCLPENGGYTINCDDNPGFMAGGTPVDGMYGYAAACPSEWFDKELVMDLVGKRHCLDTGGGIKPTYRYLYTKDGFDWVWCIVIDVLYDHELPAPEWEYELVNWSLN